MGFLKFLKKEKRRDDLDELDLPPAPPPLEGFHDNSSFLEFPDLGEKHEEMPDFNFNEDDFKDLGKEDVMKEFPRYSMQENPVPMPPMNIPQPINEAEEQEPANMLMPKEKPAFAPEKKPSRMAMGTSLYIKVDRFKIALGSINVVRNDLKKTEDALMKLEEIKSMEEKSMNKIRLSLDDLQKKLAFVDKTLFGEG